MNFKFTAMPLRQLQIFVRAKNTITEYEQKGYEFTKGVFRYLIKIAYYFIIIIGIITIFQNIFNIKTDDSDLNGWNRSGLKIHTDYKTGVQYLSTSKGHLAPRLDKNGNLIIQEP